MFFRFLIQRGVVLDGVIQCGVVHILLKKEDKIRKYTFNFRILGIKRTIYT